MLVNHHWQSSVARFFCVSDAQRQILIQAGMPASLLVVKHNFVPDTGIRRAGPGEHLLFLGRISEEKGLPILMAAWDHLTAKNSATLPLLLAGTGPMEDVASQWAAGHDNVRYLGLCAKEQCEALLVRAAAVVVPSASVETFGLTVVEAMVAGVPAVAADHSSLAELVQDGVTGILYRPGEVISLAAAIERIVSNPKLNSAMGDAARRRYELAYTPDIGLNALLAGYHDVITGATAPTHGA